MYLVHFDSGARGDFLNEWLTGKVSRSVKSKHNVNMKIHQLNPNISCRENPNEIADLRAHLCSTNLYKVRINCLGAIPQVMFDSMSKSIHNNPDEMYAPSMIYAAGMSSYNYNRAVFEIIRHYDIIIPYHMLTSIDSLIEIYETILNKKPSDQLINDARINLSLQKSYKTCTDTYQLEQYENLQSFCDSIPSLYRDKFIKDTTTQTFVNFATDLPVWIP